MDFQRRLRFYPDANAGSDASTYAHANSCAYPDTDPGAHANTDSDSGAYSDTHADANGQLLALCSGHRVRQWRGGGECGRLLSVHGIGLVLVRFGGV